ncbi:MAG: pyridoxal phosphate-dependent aminotransferase family protein [Pedobacter sp.]|nr:MAG: pyridoxal phosphate-dependent aminotransferase family protein [Pedobacter sp.]
MHHLKKPFLEKLSQRQKEGNYRNLIQPENLIDFYSNDYLGFSRDTELQNTISLEIAQQAGLSNLQIHGATGSRLISGNSAYAQDLEFKIAQFHEAEAALLFNSGYSANLGLLSAIGIKEVTFLYDELCHASLLDGMRLGYAKRYKYKHQDLCDLERLLKLQTGTVFIITESVFSMDGDTSPLIEIVNLCKKYEAQIIVDEAHSLGIFGNHGKGLVDELNLTSEIFACIFTYGKALGSHGAAITGSNDLINYLINFSRPFIYTTALSIAQLASIKCGYEKLMSYDYPKILKPRNTIFAERLTHLAFTYTPSKSCIHSLIIGNKIIAKKIAQKLTQSGIHAKAILAPTVATNTERIRLCYHLFNTAQETEELLLTLQQIS